jgi:hypothetical protein
VVITEVGSEQGQRLTFKFSNSGTVQAYSCNPELIGELVTNRDKYPLTCYSSKIVHKAPFGFELITDTESEPPPWIKSLKIELGMPNNVLLRQITTRGNIFGARWQNYFLRFLGIVIEQETGTECSWPFWRISDEDGKDIELVQVWYQRVACLSSPVYCDVRWHPERGETVNFTNLENVKRGRDINLAWRGRVLLQKINPRGRPENSVTLTRAQFMERAPQACAMLLETYGETPTDVQIAAALQISRATFFRYMERYNLSLNQIRDIAFGLLIEPTNSPF